MFFFVSIALYAQDSTMMQTPSPSTTGSDSSMSSQSQSSSSPRSQDLSFNTEAARLANELVNQTGVSTDKSVEITEILKNYRNDVAEARAKYFEKHPNEAQNQDVTGSSSTDNTANVNMGGILGTDVEKYYVGASPDLMSDYKDADKSADKDIKKVFDNDVQTSRYEQVKGQWWSSVKEKVFQSLKQSSQNQSETK
jgi:hypothetical protein